MSAQFVLDGKAVSPLEYEKVLAAKMLPQEKAALLVELKTQYGSKLRTISLSMGTKRQLRSTYPASGICKVVTIVVPMLQTPALSSY